jgi:hypothetical protein
MYYAHIISIKPMEDRGKGATEDFVATISVCEKNEGGVSCIDTFEEMFDSKTTTIASLEVAIKDKSDAMIASHAQTKRGSSNKINLEQLLDLKILL